MTSASAVVVRAINVEAERYWHSWNFIPSRENPPFLTRSIQDARLWVGDITRHWILDSRSPDFNPVRARRPAPGRALLAACRRSPSRLRRLGLR